METREVTESYRLSQWAEVVQERSASGETVEAFCQRKGIGRHKYYYWQQKLRKAAGKQLCALREKTAEMEVGRFTEVKLRETSLPLPSSSGSQITMETASLRLTADSGYPMEMLMAVLREIKVLC